MSVWLWPAVSWALPQTDHLEHKNYIYQCGSSNWIAMNPYKTILSMLGPILGFLGLFHVYKWTDMAVFLGSFPKCAVITITLISLRLCDPSCVFSVALGAPIFLLVMSHTPCGAGTALTVFSVCGCNAPARRSSPSSTTCWLFSSFAAGMP